MAWRGPIKLSGAQAGERSRDSVSSQDLEPSAFSLTLTAGNGKDRFISAEKNSFVLQRHYGEGLNILLGANREIYNGKRSNIPRELRVSQY